MAVLNKTNTKTLEQYFSFFRENIIGINQTFNTPYGEKKLIYTDWTASGRLYAPIEEKLSKNLGPFVANTHTQTTISGTAMTRAYAEARAIIKKHVNANQDDVLINTGTGMTGAINKFLRILGLKIPEQVREFVKINEKDRPVVFISHMEHHSNQTSWLETIAKVEVVPCNEEGLFCLDNFEKLLHQYKDKTVKIASVTSCSNVTGIKTPYYEIAKLIHQHHGVCFVDFACSAPYIDINMHPEDPEMALDAIFISPHKFLGGPGSSGVLLFNKKLYNNSVPDCPGGGTVQWTTPWGTHKYIENIEEREDGGTPGFLQVIRTAFAMKLKEQMGVKNILARESELLKIIFTELKKSDKIQILAAQHENRLGVVSFNIEGLHHDLAVKILNDKYGIQSRGGCSCAGTYGHYLLSIDQEKSSNIFEQISCGIHEIKPGWIRVSIHPTTTNIEVEAVCEAILEIAQNVETLKREYEYVNDCYKHKTELIANDTSFTKDWFNL